MVFSSQLKEVKSVNGLLNLDFRVGSSSSENVEDKNVPCNSDIENIDPKSSSQRGSKSLKRVSLFDLEFLSQLSSVSNCKAEKSSSKEVFKSGSLKSASSFDLTFVSKSNNAENQGTRPSRRLFQGVSSFDEEILSSIKPQCEVSSDIDKVADFFASENLKKADFFDVSLFEKKKNVNKSHEAVANAHLSSQAMGKTIIEE